MENKINQNTSNSTSNLHMRSADPKVHKTFLSPGGVYHTVIMILIRNHKIVLIMILTRNHKIVLVILQAFF